MTDTKWAQKAYERFQHEATDQRRQEDIKTLRSKTIAARSKTLWRELREAFISHANAFNRLARWNFLEVRDVSQYHFFVQAPKLSLVLKLTEVIPAITYEYAGRADSRTEGGGGRYEFIYDNGGAWMVDKERNRVTPASVAEILLDKLVV